MVAWAGRGVNPLRRDRRKRLDELQTALGDSSPTNAHAKIARMLDRLELLLIQVTELEKSRDAVLEDENPDRASSMIQQLAKLRGIGVQSAIVLVHEGFVREFANGKALGSYAGLTAAPYSSGGIEREQGIGKAGNARLRTVMVELAWLWRDINRALPRCAGSVSAVAQVAAWQGNGGGSGRKAMDRLVAFRDPRRCPGGRSDEARVLIQSPQQCPSRTTAGHTDPRGRRRCPA
jgi:transposase